MPGLSRGEFRRIADRIRWFERLSPLQRIEAGRRLRERIRRVEGTED